jgi:hypothetical protein
VFPVLLEQFLQDSRRCIGTAVVNENDFIGLAYFPQGSSHLLIEAVEVFGFIEERDDYGDSDRCNW